MSPEGAQWVLICQGNLGKMSLGLAGSIAFTRQGPEVPILSRLPNILRRKVMLRHGLSFWTMPSAHILSRGLCRSASDRDYCVPAARRHPVYGIQKLLIAIAA
jgi:hypothetical protein